MNVFDIIPSDFFNCLAGKSNNRVYADCLELIHNQYDKEISYRLERSYLRDVLAAFLLENHLDLSDEENTANAGNDEANFVLRKFISVGWLEEEQDDFIGEHTDKICRDLLPGVASFVVAHRAVTDHDGINQGEYHKPS